MYVYTYTYIFVGEIYDRLRRFWTFEEIITGKPTVAEYFIVVRHRMNASVYLLQSYIPLIVYTIVRRILYSREHGRACV